MPPRTRQPKKEPGSLSLDERLELIEETIADVQRKVDRVLLLLVLSALGIGGSAALDVSSAVAAALTR